MKKILLIFSLIFISAIPSYATHLMGGEIVATQLSDSTYEIKLTVYRDTLGIAMDQYANFKVRDNSGTVIMSFSTPQDTSVSGTLLRLYPYGIEIYCFRDTIVLPGAGTYHVSFEDCCRNGAIQNMSTPLSENMYLTTTITYFPGVANSTPFFLVRPVIFLPVNTPWAYNPLPFDVDGDSLVYRLDTPYTDHMTNVAGFVTPSSSASGPFTIDTVTSTISWTANAIGNFDATVLTEEYRNGVKIGEIRRDMQFIVVAPTSTMPYISNMSEIPTNSTGNYHVGLLADERYEFSFFAEDPDSSHTVELEAFGEPFLFSSNHAKFSFQKTGKSFGNEIEGKFVWTPNQTMARNKPYLVVYRVSNGIFANDETVLYNVYSSSKPPTGVNEIISTKQLIGSIYPNPAKSLLHIPIDFSEETNLSMEIYSLNGMRVADLGSMTVASGKRILIKPIDLTSGQYIVVFKDGNQLIANQQITVLR